MRPAAQFPIPPPRATFLNPKSPTISVSDMSVMSRRLILELTEIFLPTPQIKTRSVEVSVMDAIEAVLELAKERDELASIVESYEEMLESLVGKKVLLTAGRKGHKRFIECTVTDFHGTDGWELVSTEDEEEVHMITFEDFVTGRVQLA